MAATIKWKPNPEPDVDSYNVYKSNNQTAIGPYTLVGTVPHNGLVPELTFLDPAGTLNDYYKLATVNLDNVESLATNAFKPFDQSGLTRLYDVIFDAARKPKSGVKVSAKLDVPQAEINGIVVTHLSVETFTDVNGVWFLDLFPNSVLDPAGTEYIITIQGVNPPQRLTLPVATIVQYSALVTP